MRKPKRSRSRKTQATPRRSRARTPRAKPPPSAFSISEFCEMFGFSPAMFWKLKSQGLGPREMRIGRRILISAGSARAWREAREEAASASA